MIEKKNPYLSEMARRPPKRSSLPLIAPLNQPNIDWPRISATTQIAENHASVWNLKPNMSHYPPIIRWIAILIGKLVLFFGQVITKPQQEFNHTVLQAMKHMVEGVKSLERYSTILSQQSNELSWRASTLVENIIFLENKIDDINSRVATQVQSDIQKLREEQQCVIREIRVTIATDQRDRNEKYRLLVNQMNDRIDETNNRLHQIENIERQFVAFVSENLETINTIDRRIADADLRIDQLQKLESLKESVKEIQQQIEVFSDDLEKMDDELYVAFEDKFRGTRDDIMNRHRVYLPLLRQTNLGTPEYPVIDIGCGRGEWLQLLKNEQFTAHGVDLNASMIESCKAIGLEVTRADALEYLLDVHDSSIGAITGFHIIEHLPLKVWLKMIDESYRILRSGGIVIFESPNPANILVGSNNFYLDPTHRNPLPADMVKFMVEARGFAKVEILNLHPVEEKYHIQDSSEVSKRFNHYFYGPQDYAMVGYKP